MHTFESISNFSAELLFLIFKIRFNWYSDLITAILLIKYDKKLKLNFHYATAKSNANTVGVLTDKPLLSHRVNMSRNFTVLIIEFILIIFPSARVTIWMPLSPNQFSPTTLVLETWTQIVGDTQWLLRSRHTAAVSTAFTLQQYCGTHSRLSLTNHSSRKVVCIGSSSLDAQKRQESFTTPLLRTTLLLMAATLSHKYFSNFKTMLVNHTTLESVERTVFLMLTIVRMSITWFILNQYRSRKKLPNHGFISLWWLGI